MWLLTAQCETLILNVSSTPDLNILQVLVHDSLLQSLLKVTFPLKEVKKCCVQCIYIKKEKVSFILTSSFSYHISYNLTLWHFDSVKSF